MLELGVVEVAVILRLMIRMRWIYWCLTLILFYLEIFFLWFGDFLFVFVFENRFQPLLFLQFIIFNTDLVIKTGGLHYVLVFVGAKRLQIRSIFLNNI